MFASCGSTHIFQHNHPFPREFKVFFQQLSEDTDQAGFQYEAAQVFGGMDTTEQETLFTALRSSLDLAVHVSPLVLLAKVPGQSYRMLRSKLVQVCYSLSANRISAP